MSAAQASPLLEVIDIHKNYELEGVRVHALRGVSLSIFSGEFVAVMGPSGCGKSTFLNLLGCLDRPTSGQYLFSGVDIAGLGNQSLAQMRNRNIGFVFQSFNLLPRITALRNVEIPLLYAGVERQERRRRALQALGQLGLADRCKHRPTQLSGGQQQRVALARALLNKPRLLLADEPTGALDSEQGTQIMNLLLGLNESGLTIVMVTHDPAVAAFAHRVIRFQDGQAVEGEVGEGIAAGPHRNL